MELSGKITKLLTLQTGQGKNGTWKKQEYLLEYGDQYPKTLCFNLWGDKIDQFALTEGEPVTVFFDVESREFNGKYYTDVKAWRVDKTQGGIPENKPDTEMGFRPASKSEFGVPAPDFLESGDKDDLPF
jgi:hypothetical protein